MARAWFFLVLLNSSSFSATRLSISCLTWASSSCARSTLFSSVSKVASASSKAACSSSFSVSNLRRCPWSFVIWIVDFLGNPWSFVVWVWNHWCFPITIILVVPVFWLLRIWVNNHLLLNPIVWLLVIRVYHHRVVNPVIWLGHIGVVDLFRELKIPEFFYVSAPYAFPVDFDIESVIRFKYKNILMCVLIIRCSNVFVDQQVLIFVPQNSVHLSSRAAEVRPKHYLVLCVSVKLLQAFEGIHQLKITSSAINVLLMLNV